MQLRNIPFETTDWANVTPTKHAGQVGEAHWRTRQFGDVRVRMVEYTPGYVADHWCEKGHVLLCLDGELHTELKDGRVIVLTPGVSYQVGDGNEPHRARTDTGAVLFIVD
ncbi:MAG TPA: DHCW motif cupin fold protein [Polyangiales bacterium]|jgi:quercetin dioxygenase-like cupin family protein|nr:DHCW motif cupin fold protein [Polyangiales bacterium]